LIRVPTTGIPVSALPAMTSIASSRRHGTTPPATTSRSGRRGQRLPAVASIGLAALALLVASPASAQSEQRAPAATPVPTTPAPTAPPAPTPAGDEPPWSRGVTAEQRARAQALLEEGNELFLRAQHREALARYQEAARAWDHPAIRFNIVRALIQLDRPVEAFENLELALRHGSAPLEEQIYVEAQAYDRLLRGRIAELEIATTQPDVVITLDGRPFLRGPGMQRTRLLPGNHQVVGEKPGHLTVTRDVVVLPGANDTIEITLPTFAEATVTTRRWAIWKPWAVLAGGAATVGLGVLLERESNADLDQYRADLEDHCREVPCRYEDLPESTRALERDSRLEHRLAIGAFVLGGAAAAAGLTMVVLNRPTAVLPDDATGATVGVAPAIGPGLVGATAFGRF
jgi:tetratricopeptide (TPR) repeat protein